MHNISKTFEQLKSAPCRNKRNVANEVSGFLALEKSAQSFLFSINVTPKQTWTFYDCI